MLAPCLLKMKGRYFVEHFRKGKFIGRYKINNDITNEGKNTIFDTMFNTATQITNGSWCLGLISLVGYSGLVATDVMNSHAGWTEFTSYSESNRVAWGSGASSAQTVTNSTPCQFDMTSSGTVKGIFVTSDNTKGGTTGKLWSTGLFTADVPVVNGDQLKVTYTLNA
jgi:hypothetical protein